MKRSIHPLVIVAFIFVAILYLYMRATDDIILSIPAPIRPYAATVLVLAIVAIWFLRGRRK